MGPGKKIRAAHQAPHSLDARHAIAVLAPLSDAPSPTPSHAVHGRGYMASGLDETTAGTLYMAGRTVPGTRH